MNCNDFKETTFTLYINNTFGSNFAVKHQKNVTEHKQNYNKMEMLFLISQTF